MPKEPMLPPMNEWNLEPLPGEEAAKPTTGRAKFSPNTRAGDDRRVKEERREGKRDLKERRKTDDRRPNRGWSKKGKNI